MVFSLSNKKIGKRGKFFIKKAKVYFSGADIYNRSKENRVEDFRNRFLRPVLLTGKNTLHRLEMKRTVTERQKTIQTFLREAKGFASENYRRYLLWQW